MKKLNAVILCVLSMDASVGIAQTVTDSTITLKELTATWWDSAYFADAQRAAEQVEQYRVLSYRVNDAITSDYELTVLPWDSKTIPTEMTPYRIWSVEDQLVAILTEHHAMPKLLMGIPVSACATAGETTDKPLTGYGYLLGLLREERLFRALHNGMSSQRWTQRHASRN